MGYNYRGTTPY